jgi:serine/threonine protein phosphatase PrpC
MAEKPGQEKSLHELRQQAAHSRDRLARDLSGLRYELDFPLKFRKSFQRQTILWIGAAIVVGVVAVVLMQQRQRAGLQERFGPEYDRVVEETGPRASRNRLQTAALLRNSDAVWRTIERERCNIIMITGDHPATAAARAGDHHLQLAHVGDSRAYLLRDGSLAQLTTDHTVVAELVRRGRLTPEQAAIHPERSILTRAVGLDPRVPVDTPDPLELHDGDQVLLCSDGLTEAVHDDQIAELLSAAGDGDAACRSLIDAANAAGGPDNITVVLLRAG